MAIIRVHVELDTHNSTAYELRDSIVAILENSVGYMPGESIITSEVEDD